MSALLRVYQRDLVVVSGKGARLVDAQGRTYTDLSAAASAIGSRTAAVFVEPIQGEGGVRPALRALETVLAEAP